MPRPRTLTPELLAEDLLAEVCTLFKSLERVRTLLTEAVVEGPEKSRRRVREARHAMASAMQIALYAIEECRLLQGLLVPHGGDSGGSGGRDGNGRGGNGSGTSRSPK